MKVMLDRIRKLEINLGNVPEPNVQSTYRREIEHRVGLIIP